jgi:hypothetical protein
MKVTHLLRLKRLIASALAVLVFTAGVGAPRLNAMVMPTQQAAPMTASFDRSADMATLQATLENKVVRQRLHDLGLSDSEIERRLTRLSDDQLHQVAMQIDQQVAAGDGGATVITVLVIAILLVLLIRLVD